MKLPIDVIPGTRPVLFHWRQLLDTPIGLKCINHEGPLSPTVESAVADLIGIAKQLAAECDTLKVEIEGLMHVNQGLADRVASQSELLTERAMADAPNKVPFKKGRG